MISIFEPLNQNGKKWRLLELPAKSLNILRFYPKGKKELLSKEGGPRRQIAFAATLPKTKQRHKRLGFSLL